MNNSIHELWAIPIGILLTLWAALIVLGIKGLLFHRAPRRTADTPQELPSGMFDPDTGEFVKQPGLGKAGAACLIIACWPLLVADKIDQWLPPPRG